MERSQPNRNTDNENKEERMLENLEENEVQVATKLIFDGLSMAKASMEMILQSPITLKKIDYGDPDHETPHFESKSAHKVHLVKTELKGELKGSCHLIFSDDDVDRINKACLPENVINDDSSQSKMMKMAFLTEIDNMVSAAVITEFANFLGLEIFGHVPSLHLMESTEVNNFLKSETSDFDSIIHFKAIFHGKELDISPDFVWIFNEKFVDKIKQAI